MDSQRRSEFEERKVERLKASSGTNCNKLAGSIAFQFKQYGTAEVTAIGAAAVNQTMKAVAIARGFLAPLGINLLCYPAFYDFTIDNEERTGMLLIFVDGNKRRC